MEEDHSARHDDEQTHNRKQIEMMYRGYGTYYTEIVRSMSDKIFNWAFTLNTGALAISITFMGAAIKWDSASWPKLLPFLILIVIFSTGIGCIVVAAKLEHLRFDTKGSKLDGLFNEFNSTDMSMTEFLNKFPPKTSCLDFSVSWLENLSYYIFFLGVILSLGIITFK